jgi:hypothetical protein
VRSGAWWTAMLQRQKRMTSWDQWTRRPAKRKSKKEVEQYSKDLDSLKERFGIKDGRIPVKVKG